MTELQKEFEATGYTSWINADLYPDEKIYTKEYTQWLERQVLALHQSCVVGRIEQLARKSCDHACGPSDYYKGGKCDKMGCYEG